MKTPTNNLGLAARCSIDQLVDRRLRSAQMSLEIGDVAADSGEPEAAIVVDMKRLADMELRIVEPETGAVITVHRRHALETTVEVEHPGMIGTPDGVSCISLARRTELSATMRAAVVKHMHLAVGIPGHDQRLAADLSEIIVSRIRDLALMANIDPGAFENAFHLEIEDLRIRISLAMRPIRLHQCRNFSIRPGHAVLRIPLAVGLLNICHDPGSPSMISDRDEADGRYCPDRRRRDDAWPLSLRRPGYRHRPLGKLHAADQGRC